MNLSYVTGFCIQSQKIAMPLHFPCMVTLVNLCKYRDANRIVDTIIAWLWTFFCLNSSSFLMQRNVYICGYVYVSQGSKTCHIHTPFPSLTHKTSKFSNVDVGFNHVYLFIKWLIWMVVDMNIRKLILWQRAI